MKKRLLITILILLLVTGCTVNDSSGLTVISKEIEVMSTSDYYLQDFDVSMMNKNNDLTYEIIVDKNIVLRDHVIEVLDQHISEEKVAVLFNEREGYEKLFKSPVISDLEITYTIELNDTGKVNVQIYPIYGVVTANDMNFRIPLGIHADVIKDIELSVTYVEGKLAFEVVNYTDKRSGIFDASMRLEKLIDQEWIKVPFAEGVGFCGNASSFDENGQYGPIVFEHLFESIESGEYRFSLIVSDDISIRDAKDSSRVYARFEVSE